MLSGTFMVVLDFFIALVFMAFVIPLLVGRDAACPPAFAARTA